MRNVAVVSNRFELCSAQANPLCRFIIQEANNMIFTFARSGGTWQKSTYIICDEDNDIDFKTTGLEAYRLFYNYCGHDEVERMKLILPPIEIYESCEQMRYANIDYIDEKIYQPIYEYDVNSSFTSGVMHLPKGFEHLKEYMLSLYQKKASAINKVERSRYKNLQNYLVGYFARIKQFIALRSAIIFNSNLNVKNCMHEINRNGGKVFLSNTDSIVTDEKGAEVMQHHLGENVGSFKFVRQADRLCYHSSVVYQIGDNLTYSGVRYFARKHTDLFANISATQYGSFINVVKYVSNDDDIFKELCFVENGEILVISRNVFGEEVGRYLYKIGG